MATKNSKNARELLAHETRQGCLLPKFDFFASGVHFGRKQMTHEDAREYATRLHLSFNEVKDEYSSSQLASEEE